VENLMNKASEQVASGEVTVATRSVELDGVSVEVGQMIGVAEGRLCAAGPTVDSVLSPVLEAMDVANRELVSIYYGQDVELSEAEAVAAKVQALHPDVEIELLAGGQAIYHFILGSE
jgi:uncharacterized protein